jgi:hypothetical protein
VRKGKLRLEDEWSKLQDPETLEAWLDEITATDWNVFIEGPPNGKSEPTDVLKYLARYMTGGPISDRRLISNEEGVVTFWARSKDKGNGNKSEPYPLRGTEFVRRWVMHILPKGYTRSRAYGGYHGTKRVEYLERCRNLLGITNDEPATRSKTRKLPHQRVLVAKLPWCASSPNPVRVGSEFFNGISTQTPLSTPRCTTCIYELPRSTRSTNMDSNFERPWEGTASKVATGVTQAMAISPPPRQATQLSWRQTDKLAPQNSCRTERARDRYAMTPQSPLQAGTTAPPQLTSHRAELSPPATKLVLRRPKLVN